MKEIIPVRLEDINNTLYFIASITQKHDYAMPGSLSSRGDLMGGILDRWINLIPESVILNKKILRDTGVGNSVHVITDFYLYDPKIAGISPDVIGLKIRNKTVPFVRYNNKWEAVDGMPQIEVKTFKKPQKMVSLRNQGYDDKYLVLVESDFKVDYLVPCLKQSLFSHDVYVSMKMDDETFIIADDDNNISQIDEISTDDTGIGNLRLLKVTVAKDFMDIATHCEGGVSVQYVNDIEEHGVRGGCPEFPLSDLVVKNSFGVYSFNENWYNGLSRGGVPYFVTKNGTKIIARTLDIEVENLRNIVVVKKNASPSGSIYARVKGDDDALINGVTLKPNIDYKISFSYLNRSGNDGDEYFFTKSIMKYIPDHYERLLDELRKIIKNNK